MGGAHGARPGRRSGVDDGLVRRPIVALVLGLLAALAIGRPVHADPAGPTDYRSEVVGVDPPTAVVHLDVLGGDSFVELVAEPGTEVIVVGYQGEDYLWFRGDGTVWENRSSPSTYTNEERYGSDVPSFASADAPPDWVRVGTDHRFAWHDHRAHWMQRIRPPGLSPGDQILEAVIPLRVDGGDVDVTVISTWQPEPSAVPRWVGFVGGLVLAAAAFALRSTRVVGVPVLAIALPALVAGVWQYTSLPAETGPRWLWWVLPAVATVAAVVATIAGASGRRFVAWGATLLAGAQLAPWGWIKRDGLSAAIVPTGAPGWFDRLATATALAGGVGLVVVSLVVLYAGAPGLSAPRARSGSPRPAHP